MLRITENLTYGMDRTWQIDDVVVDKKTNYQHVVIGRTAQGLSLFCDDERQSTDLTQRCYHEGQVVPAFLIAKDVKSVLIIGSSEGVATKMCRALGAKVIDHVDIDKECVELCAEHLPYGYNVVEVRDMQEKSGLLFDGCVTTIHFMDGLKAIDNCITYGSTYDMVIMDLPDENIETESPVNQLYSYKFFEQIKSILNPGGVFHTQAGCSSLWRNETLRLMWARMRKVFNHVTYFELEEQDWVWLSGHAHDVGFSEMKRNLAKCAKKTDILHIDGDTLNKATVPCKTLRDMERSHD